MNWKKNDTILKSSRKTKTWKPRKELRWLFLNTAKMVTPMCYVSFVFFMGKKAGNEF
jgi:hypothetical protein